MRLKMKFFKKVEFILFYVRIEKIGKKRNIIYIDNGEMFGLIWNFFYFFKVINVYKIINNVFNFVIQNVDKNEFTIKYFLKNDSMSIEKN